LNNKDTLDEITLTLNILPQRHQLLPILFPSFTLIFMDHMYSPDDNDNSYKIFKKLLTKYEPTYMYFLCR